MSKSIPQHNHSIDELPIGTGSGKIPSSDAVAAMIAALTSRNVTLRPAGPADPAAGVYTTWATAHAAAAALALNGLVFLILDNDGAAIPVPAGTWDMQNIQIDGLQTGTYNNLLFTAQALATASGCVFTNFWLGANNTGITHLGAAPLVDFDTGAAPIRAYSGQNAAYIAGGAGPVIQVSGGSFLNYTLQGASAFFGGGTFETVSIVDTAILQLRMESGILVATNTIRGLAATSLNVQPLSGVISFDPVQTNMAGTVSLATTNVLYTPGDPADWLAPAPVDFSQALDRLVQVVRVLNGGPV